MSETRSKENDPPPRSKTARALRWGAAIALTLLLLGWLASWLLERSLGTPAKKRAMQSWLDENLNADVSISGDMAVRIGLLHRSRLVFHDIEVEHPNPVGFSGKMARIERASTRVSPWAVARLYPGSLELSFQNAQFAFEQNEAGEWSHDGLMRPLAKGNAAFPFVVPRFSDWQATFRKSGLSVRRRGYELKVDIDGTIADRARRDYMRFHADNMPFRFGQADSPDVSSGSAGPVNLRLLPATTKGEAPLPAAGHCSATVKDLPISILPFVVDGIPMDESPGAFNGLIRFDEHPDAAGAIFVEGELVDAPLSVFGLPRNAALRVLWPVHPEKDNLQARIHMGPQGFGAFEMNIAMNPRGLPRLLAMRGNFAELDAVPLFFSRYLRWPDWLSRTFPSIEWRAAKWRGFGWNGDNLRLSLSRGTAGMNLVGEAETMGGRVRLSMTPDQADAPITIAAERLDAGQFAAKMLRILPGPFQAQIAGAHVNLSWRGFPDADGDLADWGTGMVWAKPVVDMKASGTWWRGMLGVADAVADDLPRWGGGDDAELRALTRLPAIPLDQVSMVVEKESNGVMGIEFRAFGDVLGQVTGLIERRRDGVVEGEYLLAGSSRLLTEVAKINKPLSLALNLLANDSPGLRVSFRVEPGQEPQFAYPFLEDARRVFEELVRQEGAQP